MTPQRQRAGAIAWDIPLSETSTKALEALHQEGLELYRRQRRQAGLVSWLAVKAELARRYLSDCSFCVHDCRVDRTQNPRGYCQLDDGHYVSGEYIHAGEEALISPTHAFFMSGCTMHCVYCHNWRDTFFWSEKNRTTPAEIVQQITLRASAAKTLSWLGGTPEPHLHTLLAVARDLPPEIHLPFVFNSNATLSATGLALMEGVIDIYLPDFKHGNNACAWKVTKINSYMDTLLTNLRAYKAQNARILIRHLMLPGHLACCTLPVLEHIAREFAHCPVNLMSQYRPMYKAENIAGLDQKIAPSDVDTAQKHAQDLGVILVS